MNRLHLLPLLVATAVSTSGCEAGSGTDRPEQAMDAIREAEDARGQGTDGIEPLERGIQFPHPVVRHAAARAIGRLERANLIPLLESALADSSQTVRVEAVNAVGQAATNGGADLAFAALSRRLPAERDPVVRGVIGQTMGRLRYGDAGEHERAEAIMVGLLSEPAPTPASAAARTLALVRGFESLARIGRTLRPLGDEARSALGELTTFQLAGSGSDGPAAPRIRRTALTAFVAAGPAPDPGVVEGALSDPDAEVRRIAARGLAALPRPEEHLRAALSDPAGPVRWEALRIAGSAHTRAGCAAILDGTSDRDGHVRLLALDLLAEPCPQAAEQLQRLVEVAAGPVTEARWHEAAHATVSLARLAPQEAGAATRALAASESPFARAYAARAALHIADTELLSTLAADTHHNVREQAIRGLASRQGRAADRVLLGQLDSVDPQLVMTAASLLEGTEAASALPELFDALERFTASRRETSRDVRMALLERISELGTPDEAERLEPYLSDFDPAIAERAAAILGRWLGAEQTASPEPLPRAPVPTVPDLERLRRTTVVLDMGSGREVAIRLFPGIAPTNAARFERLARAGYFDGLTFHRVAPNFVVQGGSPGANEYWGDGPYTRDELGLLGNWRGTVGLSTRGRDTGDGQLYVNLVDNPRLDHDYTVFGEIVGGMDVIDGLQEGARIVSARAVEAPDRP